MVASEGKERRLKVRSSSDMECHKLEMRRERRRRAAHTLRYHTRVPIPANVGGGAYRTVLTAA